MQKLGAFKSRFPYSKFAALAELFIANSHFELGRYEEAAIEYKQFVRLHPKHEKSPFAMFRVGESYWIDAPEEVDRDQELTQTALTEWRSLLAEFPDSKYAKQARERVIIGKKRIAESHRFIAEFYCKMELYHACAYRFIKLLEEYPEYEDLRKTALIKAGESLLILAERKKEKPDLDTNVFYKKMGWQAIEAKGNELLRLSAQSQKSNR